MKYSTFILVIGLAFISCNKTGVAKGTPKCVEDKIIDFQANKVCSEGAKVELYTFQGELVYAFVEGTCGSDLTTEIISEDCESLGFLGGITGNITINGENFENAIFQEITWQD